MTASTLTPAVAAAVQQDADLGTRALSDGNPDMAITFFISALAKIHKDYPLAGFLTHNLLLAYKVRIEQLFATGRPQETNELLDAALCLELGHSQAAETKLVRHVADAFQNLGLLFFENAMFSACVRCCRKALSLFACPTYHVNLLNSLAILKQPAVLSDFTTRITGEQLGTHMFIACAPKSASTFLKNVVVNLTGFRDLFAVFAAGQNEHDLYLPSLAEFADVNTVTQQHCRASEATIQLMQAFEIRPVVLVRNIFDSVVSLLDFYRQGAAFNSYFKADFMNLDEETQIDLLIDNVVPWYLQFVASWQLVEKERRLEIFWLDYFELTTRKVESVEGLLEFYGIGASAAAIGRAVDATESDARRNRFNKGVTGRGRQTLTDSQKARIIRLTSYFPSTDFQRIGL